MSKTIKLPGGVELTEEQMAELMQQAQRKAMNTELASNIIAAHTEKKGIGLTTNIMLDQQSVACLVAPEHPLLPELTLHKLAKSVMESTFNNLMDIYDQIRQAAPLPGQDPAEQGMAVAAAMGLTGALDVTNGATDPSTAEEDEGQVGTLHADDK